MDEPVPNIVKSLIHHTIINLKLGEGLVWNTQVQFSSFDIVNHHHAISVQIFLLGYARPLKQKPQI